MGDNGVWVKMGEAVGGLSWGDFITNGDETTSDTWGPDSEGRMWKWAEWTVANDYSVNLTGGLYWVLCVGGGDGGYNTNNNNSKQGQPGLVNEGFWEFDKRTHNVTVGKKGAFGSAELGQPSFIDDRVNGYGTQGVSNWGQMGTGRGAFNNGDTTGYKSRITGAELQYAPGQPASLRPGRAGDSGSGQADGCVIIATAAPNAKALNWVHTTYHAEVSDGVVTAVHTQKHYADGTTTPLPASELIDATYGVSEGWLFVNGELQPPPAPPEPTVEEKIAALQTQIEKLKETS